MRGSSDLDRKIKIKPIKHGVKGLKSLVEREEEDDSIGFALLQSLDDARY